tara:strand:+ start:374 stop:652 length:279 start_codon:yes stop_codon:yes gene_type:complete
MNEHILFVIDHLANPDKYTQEELDANRKSAYDAADAAVCDAAAYATRNAAYWAAYYAASAASAAAYSASHWVAEYFKITGEDKQTYIDKLGE